MKPLLAVAASALFVLAGLARGQDRQAPDASASWQRDDQAVIGINGFPLDTSDRDGLAARLSSIPDHLRAQDAPASGDSLWLVQFAGPIQDAWLDRLAATGAVVVSPMASHAYVVRVDAASLAAFSGLRRDEAVRWIGAYHPWFRLAPDLRALDFERSDPIDVLIQLIAGDAATRLVDALARAGFGMRGPVEEILAYVNVRIAVPRNRLPALAAHPAVFGIEPLFRPELDDEVQGQLMAGSLNAIQTGPSAPGYLAWLASKGFASGQFAFVVDVTDSGVDRGSLTDVNDEFRVLGPGGASRLVYANNYTNDPLADCGDGHGNLGASIVGGYNALTGSAFEDANGYNYGLGICPFVQLGDTKVFDILGTPAFLQPHATRLSAAYGSGARISNNSWGVSNTYNYNADSQTHDALVRDANAAASGNQELTLVFSCGNDGNGAGTVHAPATAKNVISVGAAESYRPSATDGCTILGTGADNVRDIINFSSRGPTVDQRKKPDIMAPGTHVQGALSRSLNYNGGGVCNFAWPAGQSLYTWSSGTSFSAPAIGGACALVRQWFLNQGQAAPSPAMVKALLMTTTRYMNGIGANDTLWSNNQGMGLVDLGRAFDAAPQARVDQTHVFGSTGQTYVVAGTIASAASPFRVGLTWTDAPGPTTGNAWVNNLDLTVTVSGTTYKGNVFSGASSVAGGLADAKNNAEFVFLPAGATGSFTVTVTATNIAGDAIPGNADPTDQDFALVVYNGTACSPTIAAVSPPAIAAPLGSAVTLTVTGSCFLPASVVHANCTPLATTYVNATTLTCTLVPGIAQTQFLGAVCINVQNNLNEVSNSVALPCGPGNNSGTLRRHPLVPTPGGTYALLIEGGAPNAPFTLLGDLGAVTPVGGFPDPVSNFVLALSPLTGSAGPLIPIIDGLGIFGPPVPVTLDASGKFVLPGIYYPPAPIGIVATLQVAYLDPTSPIGLRLTWARFPEQL